MSLTNIPYIEAAHYTRAARTASDIKWIIVHDMEMSEKGTTAESCAQMFHTTTREASAHYCIDNNSVVQCVHDHDIAWGAGGGNTHGLHFEHAGFASQKKTDWTDEYSRDMLALSAKLAAKKAVAYNIPVKKLTTAQVKKGDRGFCGHVEITYAFRKSTHTDPGENFPWDVYITMVKAEVAKLGGKPWTVSKLAAAAAALGVSLAIFQGVSVVKDTPTPTPKPTPSPTVTIIPTPTPTHTPTTKPVKKLHRKYPGTLLKMGNHGVNVKYVQTRLKELGLYSGSVDGDFGNLSKSATLKFQKKQWPSTKKNWDGVVGPDTWTALFTY